MNEQEIEARKICAYCNFKTSCECCPHREWPNGKWHVEPRWDHLKCEEWRYYLVSPIVNMWRRLLCWLGLHKWYVHIHVVSSNKIHRRCTRCKVEQHFEYPNDNFNRGSWLWLGRKMI